MQRWFWVIGLLAVFLSGLADRADAREVVRVDSAQMVMATLKKLPEAYPNGLTLELAPGDYGALRLHGLKADADAPLILRSANKAKPAHLSGLSIRESRHVTLENLVMTYAYRTGDPLNFRPFHIRDSAHVTLRGNLFVGDLVRGGTVLDTGFPTARGLNVMEASDIRVEDNTLHTFYRGAVFRGVRNLIVRGNDIHSIRSDGMNFAQVQDVVIENNHIHDFARSVSSEDHADMIQFWTKGTSAPSRNVTIHNNVLNSGHGWYSQSIFMRNEEVDTGRAGREMFYQNIRITQNVVINAHLNGIRIGETNGLLIANNSVLRNPRSEGKANNPNKWTPQIRVSQRARNVQITANVTSKIHGYGGQTDWRVQDNLLVQDHSASQAGFYARTFRNALKGNPRDLNSFRPLRDGPLAGQPLGAARLQ